VNTLGKITIKSAERKIKLLSYWDKSLFVIAVVFSVLFSYLPPVEGLGEALK
jgi:hypothetical protein